jgi:fatty acid desaturase
MVRPKLPRPWSGVMTPLQTRAEEFKALSELRAEIRRVGLDKPTPVMAVAVLVFHIAVMLGGIAGILLFEPLWLRALALAVSTYGALGIGMTGHNASHCAVTGSRKVDRALTYLTMTVLNGIAASYWWHKHVRMHHAAPNHIGVDDDIDLLPFFALNEDEVRAARGWRRRLYRVQHWLFPFGIALSMLNLQQTGVRFLIAEFRRRERRRGELWADVACLGLHYTLFIALPALIWPLWQVICFYLLREVLNGYIVFAAAAPAHFPAEARFVKVDGEALGPLAGQIFTTVNFRTGFWGRLVCLGAEFQIEHHLLPEANPLKMPRVSKIVEAFCRRHGYPYRQLGWGEGVVKALRVASEPKRVYHRMAELIEPVPVRSS